MPVRPRVDRLRTIYRAARGLNFGWKMSDFPSTPMYNGVCSFIPQLHRVTLRFCRQSESSTGMRNFIRNQLSQFANENPSTVVYVQPVRNTTPTLRGEYGNGRMVHIHAKGFSEDIVAKHMNLLRTRCGSPVLEMESCQTAVKDSIQGIWNPLLNIDTEQNITNLPNEKFSKYRSYEMTATEYVANLPTESGDAS